MTGGCLGRERQITELRAALAGSPGIITLIGSGGIGKSTLAHHATNEPSRWWTPTAHRVVVPFDDANRPASVIRATASALSITGGKLEHLRHRLNKLLSAGRYLLVLDDYEHRSGDAPEVRRLADDNPALRILVTSRSPLHVTGERVMVVPPLAIGRSQPAQSPAVGLFVEIARRAIHDFDPAPHMAAITSICERVDGVPLAIELAAARTATMTPHQIDDMMREGEHLTLLRRPTAGGHPRHRDLESTIDWSFQMLPQGAKDLLCDVSVFSGWFAFDDAVAVSRIGAAESLDALTALVDAQFMMSSESGDDRVHRTSAPVRQFAQRGLRADSHASLRAQSAYRSHLIATARRALTATEQAPAQRGFAVLTRIEADLIRAVDTALADSDASTAAALQPALCALWYRRGSSAAMRSLPRAASHLVAASGLPPVERAHVCGWAALLEADRLFEGGDPATIERELLEVVDITRHSGDVNLRLRSLWFVVQAARTVHNFESALTAADEAVALTRETGHAVWRGRFEGEASLVAQRLGDDERAAALATSALTHAQATDDAVALVRAASVLRPPVARWRIDPPSSCPALADALEIAIDAGDAHAWRYLYPMAAAAAAGDGQPRLAAAYCAGGLRDAVSTHNLDSGRINAFMLSVVAAALGEHTLAAELQGMIVDQWPRIARGQSHATRRVAERWLERCREQVNASAYSTAVARGAARPIRSAMPWALAHAERLSVEPSIPSGTATSALTDRERAVLRLLASGMANKEIGSRLGITAKTAMHHTSNIYRKLGVRGRIEATALAFRDGILTEQ